MISQDLVNRFLRNECNEDEQAEIIGYFDEHPNEWDIYLKDEDWEKFNTIYPFVPSNKMFEKVKNETFRSKFKLKQIYRVAAAACVLGLIVTSLFINNRKSNPKNIAKDGSEGQLLTADHLEIKFNSTSNIVPYTMSDGSIVQLAPGSTIKYYQPFITNNKRLVFLDGQATFKVAKDRQNQFVVFSGDISTTALGTTFTVKAVKETNYISVELLEGKVVIKSADSLAKKLVSDYYLMPGDELIYNKETGLANINHNNQPDQLVKASVTKSNIASNTRPDWYKFSDQGLNEVFDQLSQYFQADIYYYPSQLKNKYFTGKIDKTDSLDNILNDIALLNNLIVKKENGSYIITQNSK